MGVCFIIFVVVVCNCILLVNLKFRLIDGSILLYLCDIIVGW